MRHGVKISLSLLLILCIMAISCFNVHAAPVALTAAEELCALWAMYSESVGFSTLYSTNGNLNNINNPFSSSYAADNITDLYQRYCTYSGRIETIQETVSWIKTNTEIAISTQQTGAFQYAAGVTEFFDKFSSWVLEDVVGVVKDNVTGLFPTNTPWFNSTLNYSTTSSFLPVVDSKPNSSGMVQYGIPVTTNNFYAVANSSNLYPVFPCLANGQILFISQSRQTVYYYMVGLNNSVNQTTTGSKYDDTTYIGYGYANQTAAPGIMSFPSESDAVSYFKTSTGISEYSRIQLRTKDKYNEDSLDIPDVSSPDYAGTRVLEGVTTVPWDESLTLSDILSQVLSLSLANENVLEDDAIAPDPVISPLVPFNLPSLEFNFSGIWHYVVSWIGSLRSGFSFVASTWAALPYAMVIPIYASAVVVIVIGTFKRFFS